MMLDGYHERCKPTAGFTSTRFGTTITDITRDRPKTRSWAMGFLGQDSLSHQWLAP
jgi:hypothetical protein